MIAKSSLQKSAQGLVSSVAVIGAIASTGIATAPAHAILLTQPSTLCY